MRNVPMYVDMHALSQCQDHRNSHEHMSSSSTEHQVGTTLDYVGW